MLDNGENALRQVCCDWLSWVNSTVPVERAELVGAAHGLYQVFQKEKPAVIVCQSPWQLVIAKTLLQRGADAQLLELLRKPLNDPFAAPEERFLWTKVAYTVEGEATPELRKKLALSKSDSKGFWSAAVESVVAGTLDAGPWAAFKPKLADEQATLTKQLNELLPKAFKAERLAALQEQYEKEFSLAVPDRAFMGQVRNEVLHDAILKDPVEVKAEAISKLMPPVVSDFYHAVFAQVPVEIVPAEQMRHELKLLSVSAVNDLVFTRSLIGWLPFFHTLNGKSPSFKIDSLSQKKIDAILRFSKAIPFSLLYEGVCLVSNTPVTIQIDVGHRLHAENGPALTFSDGFQLYSWHGTTVPRFIIDEPAKITPEKILREWNAERRRIMMERFGVARFMKECGAKKIQEDEYGALYRKEIPRADPWVMVKVRNSTPEPDGTYRDYFLRVPPNMKTAKEAVAWSFRMSEKEYSPDIET